MKPELNLNDKNVHPTSLHGRILTSHVFSYCVKGRLHRSSSINTLVTVSQQQWIFQTCWSAATGLLMLLFT